MSNNWIHFIPESRQETEKLTVMFISMILGVCYEVNKLYWSEGTFSLKLSILLRISSNESLWFMSTPQHLTIMLKQSYMESAVLKLSPFSSKWISSSSSKPVAVITLLTSLTISLTKSASELPNKYTLLVYFIKYPSHFELETSKKNEYWVGSTILLDTHSKASFHFLIWSPLEVFASVQKFSPNSPVCFLTSVALTL